jgi:metallo-beta-lactamase family protein
MEIHFHGATRTVTGSCHEVRAAGKVMLLDCGLFQGPREEAKRINCCFDFDPAKIDTLILSHAHADHCGNLPNLVKQGYRSPIWCTPATAAITTLMLMDSAKIQEEDAGYLNKKKIKTWTKPIEPLYTRADVEQTIALFKALPYRTPTEVLPGVIVELRDAGHVLGSAAVSVTEKSSGKVLVFTGDVGRPHAPMLNDSDPFTKADAVISECTYGGKVHASMAEVPNQLASVVNDTVQRGGIIMVPAFALGRTQATVEILHQLRDAGKISQDLAMFVDSPLAMRITDVHRHFMDLMDEETRKLLEPFDFPNLTYVPTPQISQGLNSRAGSFVVIAGSGMCESGRILHHLKHHIAYPKNTVLLPGFQAQNTLGRRIQDGVPFVPILGDRIPLRCRVETLHGLSAHADGQELIDYVMPLKAAQVFLVHGEVPQAEAHQAALADAGFRMPVIATRGDVVTV